MADDSRKSRRGFLADGARALGMLAAGGALGAFVVHPDNDDKLWQIDPDKCIGCGRCADNCVLTPSAVKALHEWPRCGYCELCFGYYVDQRTSDLETAENQRCPVNAIKRSPVEDPYYEYVIDEPKCIGCGLCVKGCNDYGNGSLILQVRHDRCLNCDDCAIARACPAQAYTRVPKDQPYILRTRQAALEEESEAGSEPAQSLPGEPTEGAQPSPGPEPLDLPPEESVAPLPPGKPEPPADTIPKMTPGEGLGPPQANARPRRPGKASA